MAPEDQDWLVNISSEDENEEIIKAIVQTCWRWLDLIVDGIDEVDR